MKFLVDHNLSYKIAVRLQDIFPGSMHVGKLGLSSASDLEIWTFAKENGYCILTKDEDFNYLSRLSGFPPKVVWLRVGNVSVEENIVMLRATAEELKIFDLSESGLLIIEGKQI